MVLLGVCVCVCACACVGVRGCAWRCVGVRAHARARVCVCGNPVTKDFESYSLILSIAQLLR